MNDAWAYSDRGRKEILAVLTVGLIYLILPLIVKELFPFSACTMFAFQCHELSSYKVLDPKLHELPAYMFGLENGPNLFDPPVDTLGRFGFGRQFLPNIFQSKDKTRYRQTATQEEVSTLVKQGLLQHPELQYVLVIQNVYGAIDNRIVGIIATHVGMVHNPNAKL